MGCPDVPGEFGDDVSSIEMRKRLALDEIAAMDKEIERLKAEEEQRKKIDIIGLYSRMDSMIKTSASSFSGTPIDEISEMEFGQLGIGTSYTGVIDVELSGRYAEQDGEVYHTSLKGLKKVSRMDDPTLVVSFLIPFDMIDEDPFFNPPSK